MRNEDKLTKNRLDQMQKNNKKQDKFDLFKKAKQKAESLNSKHTAKNNSYDADAIKEIKRLKKLVDQCKSAENKAIQQKEKTLTELQESNEKIKILNKQIVSLTNEIDQKDKIISDYEMNMIDHKNEIVQKDKVIAAQGKSIMNLNTTAVMYRNKILLEENRKLEESLKAMDKNHKEVIGQHEYNFARLNSQMRAIDRSRAETIGNMNSLRKENLSLKGKLNSVEKIIPSYGLFEHLAKQMNIDNFRMFTGYQLITAKYYHFKKLEYERNKRFEAEGIDIIQEDDENEILYGYLVSREEEWFFVDLDDKLYSVGNVDDLTLLSDYPAKASRLADDIVSIEEVYKRLDEGIKTVNMRRKIKNKRDKDEDENYFIGNFKVLIIGSKDVNRYVDRLQKHGLEVDTHDSYGESFSVLEGKMSSADVVLYLTRHSRHLQLNEMKLEQYSDKIETMDRDNENSVVVRTRYAGIRLGLIQSKLEQNDTSAFDETKD